MMCRAGRSDDIADVGQFAGLVSQCNRHIQQTAFHQQASGNNTGQNIDVNVAAGNDADNLLALGIDLAEHARCNRNRACTFRNHFLLFNHRKDSRCDLVIGDCDNLVDILFTQLVGQIAGCLTAIPSAKVETLSSVSCSCSFIELYIEGAPAA